MEEHAASQTEVEGGGRARREADLAVRLARPSASDLICRK